MTPVEDDIARIVHAVAEGLPVPDDPTAEGGFGATVVDLTPAEQALQEEGALDEEIADETKDK